MWPVNRVIWSCAQTSSVYSSRKGAAGHVLSGVQPAKVSSQSQMTGVCTAFWGYCLEAPQGCQRTRFIKWHGRWVVFNFCGWLLLCTTVFPGVYVLVWETLECEVLAQVDCKARQKTHMYDDRHQRCQEVAVASALQWSIPRPSHNTVLACMWQTCHGNFLDPWWEGHPPQTWMAEVRFQCLCWGSHIAAMWGWGPVVPAGAGCKTQPQVSEVSPQGDDFSGFSPCPWKCHMRTHMANLESQALAFHLTKAASGYEQLQLPQWSLFSAEQNKNPKSSSYIWLCAIRCR